MKYSTKIDFEYGFVGALRYALKMFDLGASQTGRTEAMLYSARPGDNIVVATHAQERWLRTKINELGLHGLNIIVCLPERLDASISLTGLQGVTHFSHDWVMAFLEGEIGNSFSHLSHLTNRARHPNRPGYWPFDQVREPSHQQGGAHGQD